MSHQFYIAPDGNDAWSGTLSASSATNDDGPWRSFGGAADALARKRELGQLCGPVAVQVRGGRYALKQPLEFSAGNNWPITFEACEGETPVVSGGEVIRGWRETVHQGLRAWVVDLPEVKSGAWNFRSLFVNGRRALRPRLPKTGLFHMQEVPGMHVPAGWGGGGQTAFIAAPGDLDAPGDLADSEAVWVHFWIEERSPIAAYDPETRRVTLTRPSRTDLVGAHGSKLADYYIDNVKAGLDAPGLWHLDRRMGRLVYLPLPEETLAESEIIAPRLLQLLALTGDPGRGQFVEHLHFKGIVFAHTDWRHPSHDGAQILGFSSGATLAARGRKNRGADAGFSQADADLPGVIALTGARHCSFEACQVSLAGWYAIEIGDACENIQVVGCTLQDLGAGGIKVNGAAIRDPEYAAYCTFGHVLTDNLIRQGGRIFHAAVGILSMHAHRLTLAHNHIHDLFYTGISCGWEWGYQRSASHDNLIAFNHIHDIGQGLLSDMGGIYTLGVQPGTVIRGNLIHDVRSAHYGGWCIYPDEGSSHLLIENNVCYDADREPFHQHYGRENLVLNNIFAFGGEATARVSRRETHVSATFLRNIFIVGGKYALNGPFSLATGEAPVIRSEQNLYWSYAGEALSFGCAGQPDVDWEGWRARGYDRMSVRADPQFQDAARRDFTLAPDSPALALGFKPIHLEAVGPRPAVARGPVARQEPVNAGL